METNLIKIGNSRGVIIPSEMLKKLSLTENNSVNMVLEKDAVVIRAASAPKNMLSTRFYVCPVCGNVIHSMGEVSITCHGEELKALQPVKASTTQQLIVEKVEDELFVHIDHEMSKKNYISFIAAVSADRVQMVELFPEGNAEARFKAYCVKYFYYYSEKTGLVRQLNAK